MQNSLKFRRGRQEFVLREEDSNPYFHGRINRFVRYLQDGGHEDRESRQHENKNSSDSLFPGKKEKDMTWLNVPYN